VDHHWRRRRAVDRRQPHDASVETESELSDLTKGQYSPTSREGTRSPSTPFGSVDHPAKPCAFALGSGARFVARGIDVQKNLPSVLKAAHAHQGAAFIEIFQNCIVYNDEVFEPFAAKPNAAQNQLWVEDGKPMLFAGGTKGIALDRAALTVHVVDVTDGDWEAAGVIVHNVTNRAIAHMLVEMPFGPFPMALGVLYDDPAPTFESAVVAQNKAAAEGKVPDLQKLVAKGQTWMVDKAPHVL
jgi:2-oxoglutarate ferredoxin oxidoreductase subunit beta